MFPTPSNTLSAHKQKKIPWTSRSFMRARAILRGRVSKRVSGCYRSFCFVFRQTERIKRRAHCHFARRPLSMALVRPDNYVNTHQTIMFGIGARCDDRDRDGQVVIPVIDFFCVILQTCGQICQFSFDCFFNESYLANY